MKGDIVVVSVAQKFDWLLGAIEFHESKHIGKAGSVFARIVRFLVDI